MLFLEMFNRPSSGRGCRCRLGRKGRARAPRPLRPARPVPRSPEPQAPEYYGLLRLEIRNPISSGGGLLATAKGQGDAALTPVAVPGGRPRLWPSRGRPGKSGGSGSCLCGGAHCGPRFPGLSTARLCGAGCFLAGAFHSFQDAHLASNH